MLQTIQHFNALETDSLQAKSFRNKSQETVTYHNTQVFSAHRMLYLKFQSLTSK